MSLLRPACDFCGKPATRQMQGQEYASGVQHAGWVTCLCDACAHGFRMGMWRLLAGATRRPADPGLTGLEEGKRPGVLEGAISRAKSLAMAGAAAADVDRAKIPHPNDAHVFTGRCQLGLVCKGEGKREGMLTLVDDCWAPMLRTTNGRRDTVEMCKACADDWCGMKPGTAVWRPLAKLLH